MGVLRCEVKRFLFGVFDWSVLFRGTALVLSALPALPALPPALPALPAFVGVHVFCFPC